MQRSWKTEIIMAGSLMGLASVPAHTDASPAADAAALSNNEAAMLQTHNAERRKLDLPPLRWDPGLAQEAREWARHMASEGRMFHSTHAQRRSAGENLWMGTTGFWGPEIMVGTFIAEKQHFRPGTFPDVSTTGNWRDVGHYTQVIWRETEAVGCAIVEGAREEFLACRYWPAGNWWGRKVY